MALGCLRVPPSVMSRDSFDYGAAIGDSWKRMTLANVVRIRYADAPVFMNVASVINSYSVSGSLNAGASIPEGPPQNVYNLGATGNWSNAPTVSYQPLTGEQFARNLLRPIPPLSILQLMIARWSVEVIFPAAVRSVNGIRNSTGLLPADPQFDELLKLLGRIQRSGAIDLRIREGGGENSTDKDKKVTAIMVIRGEDIDPSLREDSRRVREILKLDPDAKDLEVVYGLISENPRQLAIATRSLFEIMLEFGAGIDVPEPHREDHRTLPLLGDQAGAAKLEPLVHIRSGRIWPSDPYTAIEYKGYWFWIDDSDLKSKRLFLFLMILSSLAESGQPAVAPVVTIPAR